MIERRSFLKLVSTLAGAGMLPEMGEAATQHAARVKLGSAVPFSRSALLDKAKRLAKTDYIAPAKIPQPWTDLSYDQYKNIYFRHAAALWRGSNRPFELEFFAPGLYFPTPVSIAVVDGNQARPVRFDLDVFTITDQVPELPIDATVNYSGFRVNAQINHPEIKSEFLVFQGASYFRSIGRGQIYGLSARGLAINTGDRGGEEFPEFRSFWIEGGEPGEKMLTVHALMDSPSVSGLYTFKVTPGTTTQFDVEANLFPRVEMKHIGIAAETSMFLFDQTNRNRFDDFRPAVHDSDGLLIENGAGETLWRQLANPRSLQVSSFVDNNPRGFGLMQRPRSFSEFADLEANYHKRPGLWVVPGEDWGKGAVSLVEIPADREIYDNIVAYWRPREPLQAGQSYRYTYQLYWCEEPPVDQSLARVVNTRMGKRFAGGRLATIDFSPTKSLPKDLSKVTVHISSNVGSVTDGILQNNPDTDGVRLAFTFDPGRHTSMELRAQLMISGHKASEVWLYRWTS